MIINLNTIIWIVLSIIFIAFFAGIEIAFVSINRLTIELKKKQGKKSGLLLSNLINEPSKFIGATLIGYTICLVIYGLLVGEMLLPLWNVLIQKVQIPEAYVNTVRLFTETFVGAIFIFFFGEFLPKAVWRAKNELLLNSFISGIVDVFYQLLYPIASFFVVIAGWFLKYLFNVRIDDNKEAFTKSDLENFFQQTHEQSEDAKNLNTDLFENALSLPAIKIRQCLMPRKEIIGVEKNATLEDIKNKFIETKLSRLIVFENNIDHIIGYVHQLDLFKKPTALQNILLPIPAIPESMSATDLISQFSKERKSIAWVVDEFGGTAGIVTMEDLLEEIFGEIHDEYDINEFEEKKMTDDEFMFSGRLELDYLNNKYNFQLPVDKAETLSGYIISQHEKIPVIKDHIIIGNYEFEVMAVSDTRIETVRMKILK